MPALSNLIGPQGRKMLYQAASPKPEHTAGPRVPPGLPTVRQALVQLGSRVWIIHPDGSTTRALATAHFPKEEWAVIQKGVANGDYTRNGDGTVVFTE